MNEMQEKQLKLMRLQTGMIACILVLLVAAGAFLAVQVLRLGAVVEQLDVASINETILELEEAAEGLSELDAATLNQTVEALKTAAENLGAVDMDSLNQAIEALSGAAANLKALDIESFNSLIGSLETAAQNLEKTTSGIAGIFGR